MNDVSNRNEDRSGLLDLLLQSLKELAAAGHAETACQLAGQACAVLRQHDPKGWQKFNTLLHRLTKRSASRAAECVQNGSHDVENGDVRH
jgi:hypothetical protein